MRIKNGWETPLAIPDLSSSHMYHGPCRVPSRGYDRGNRRKRSQLNLSRPTASTPCSPNMSGERGAINVAKRCASSTMNSSTTRLVHQRVAEPTFTASRSNLFPTSPAAGSRSRARVVGFARVKMFSDIHSGRHYIGLLYVVTGPKPSAVSAAATSAPARSHRASGRQPGPFSATLAQRATRGGRCWPAKGGSAPTHAKRRPSTVHTSPGSRHASLRYTAHTHTHTH